MKKPYSSIKAICTIAMILLMQTSFAQEVDTQQQTNTDATTVTEVIEESGNNALSEQVQTFANQSVDNSQFDEMVQNFLAPIDPNAALPYQASHTVDQSTGKVNVKVPLAIAGPKDIPIPVELNYSTGGIKLGERASWVGLGWNLSAGGKITRMMNKFPDKLDGSLDTLAHYTGWTFNLTTNKDNIGNFEDRLKYKDTQPDLFTFEIPGKSGTFVFDSRGTAYTIPYQNVIINYDKINEVFEIIDDAGTRYSFEHKEITEIFNNSLDREDAKCVSTWYLSSISNVKGETVEFEYKQLDKAVNVDQKYDVDTYQANTVLAVGSVQGGNDTSGAHLVSYMSEVYPLFLTKISWANGRVDFISSMRRTDFPTEAYQLDNIWIYTGTNLKTRVKIYDLKYSAFAGCKALKLDRIDVSTPQSTTSEFYRGFEYFTDDIVPAIALGNHYYEHDHWGFYNGEMKNTLGIPSVYLLDENENYVYEKSFYDKRTPVFSKTIINSLKRIWVTTSGYEEFEYELNDSKEKVDYFSKYTVGGLRIKTITTKSKELPSVSRKVRYEYLDTEGKSSGVVFNNPAYYHKTSYDGQNIIQFYVLTGTSNRSLFDLDGSHIRYKRVRELFDNGSSNTYTFTTYSDHPDDGFYVHPLTTYGYYYNYEALKIRNSDFSPTNTRFWERGLMLEKVSRNSLDSVTYIEKNEYEFDAPEKKDINGIYAFVYQGMEQGTLRPLSPSVAQYHYLSKPIYITKKTVSGIDIPEIVTKYEYDDTYYLLKKKTETSGADEFVTTYKYPFDYTLPYDEAISFMKKSHILATPIEVVQYKNDNVIGGQLNIYDVVSYIKDGNTNYPTMTAPMFCLKEVKELLLKTPKLGTAFRTSYHVPGIGGYQLIHDVDYVTKATYAYNSNNKVSCIMERNKPSQSFIYDDSQTLPIAQITNAETKVVSEAYLEEALHTSFEGDNGRTHARAKTGSKVLNGRYYIQTRNFVPGNYLVSYWVSNNDGVDWELYKHEMEVVANQSSDYPIGGSGLIDELRVHKKDALMQTKTYDLNKNVTSETDANGKTTYYEYDAFGRLITIKDNNRNKHKSYQYFIKQ